MPLDCADVPAGACDGAAEQGECELKITPLGFGCAGLVCMNFGADEASGYFFDEPSSESLFEAASKSERTIFMSEGFTNAVAPTDLPTFTVYFT